MNKMLVAVFGNESDAYNGLSAMRDLHSDGSITLYKQVVLTKDDAGEVAIKDSDAPGPIGTAVGITLGSLVGLLGGPLGALAGGYGGSLAGMVYDLQNAGVDAEFIDDVSEAMVPGTVAVLADIEEEWVAPLDTKMIECNGIVFRRLRAEVENDQIEREVELTKEDLERLQAEFKESSDEAKENIQKHIDAARKKLTALADRAKEKQDNLNKEFEEKVETLKAQSKDASEKNKAKINAQMEKNKVDYNAQMDKLERAYEAAKSELDK